MLCLLQCDVISRDSETGMNADHPLMARPAPDTRSLKNVRLTREALQKLAKLHVDWVVGRPIGKRAILENCDLRGLDFSHLNFSDAVFLNCRFDGGEGRGVKFVGAILRGSNFDRADLTSADFQRADLRSVSFQDANMVDASLGRSDIRQDIHSEGASSFKGAVLTRANFADSKLKNADFSGAIMAKTNLTNADLRGASFRHAEMNEAVINGAMLVDSDFSGAMIDKGLESKLGVACAKLTKQKTLDAGRLEKILAEHERWVLSQGTEGARANFAGLDLTGADFSGRNLALADFSGAKLAEARFDGASLMAAVFQKANMLRAKLSAADLRGADFREAHQRDLDLTDSRIGTLPGVALQTRGLAA